jgi:hypothetical protein
VNLSDQELTLYALREAQLILAESNQAEPRSLEKTIDELREVLNRADVVEAVDRLETSIGLRLA